MPEPTIGLQLKLPLDVAAYVNAIAIKAGTDAGTVIAVLLAQHVLRNPMQQPPAGKTERKKAAKK